MMDSPQITVVVPVYNMGRFLPRAMDALLAQTFRDFEVIIVDDGSTDGSADVCDQQAARDSRCSVVHKPNGGLSSARNCGLEHARGQFIIFPDPDDWVEPIYLEKLHQLHEQYGTDLEICGRSIVDENCKLIGGTKGKLEVITQQKALEYLMDGDHYTGSAWNKLFHLTIIKEQNLSFDTDLGMVQDLHFCVSYFMHCQNVVYNPAHLYNYYQHSGSVTNLNMGLTPRKLSGLLSYQRIAEITARDFPQIHDLALGTFFNLSLHFIYIYFASKMKDQALLSQLQDNLRNYQHFFFGSRLYSPSHKFLGWLAMLTPRGYYWLKRTHLRK